MRPSAPILRHFFYLRLHDPTQRSGCVSFIVVRKNNVLMSAGNKVESFRRRWVFMDERGQNAAGIADQAVGDA